MKTAEDEEFERIERETKLRQVPLPAKIYDYEEAYFALKAKRALAVPDALDPTTAPGNRNWTSETLEYVYGWNDCRQAMLAEQPAQQEPVLQDIEQYRLQMAGICTAAIGYWREGDGIQPDYDTLALQDVAALYAKYDALYKSQPEQRTWVGLTDAEVEDFVSALWPVGAGAGKLLRAIEAKLREKNT